MHLFLIWNHEKGRQLVMRQQTIPMVVPTYNFVFVYMNSLGDTLITKQNSSGRERKSLNTAKA